MYKSAKNAQEPGQYVEKHGFPSHSYSFTPVSSQRVSVPSPNVMLP